MLIRKPEDLQDVRCNPARTGSYRRFELISTFNCSMFTEKRTVAKAAVLFVAAFTANRISYSSYANPIGVAEEYGSIE